MDAVITLELHSLKELLMLRNAIRVRMDDLKEMEGPLSYQRENTIEYLTLGQILVRLPEPASITPHVCRDIQG